MSRDNHWEVSLCLKLVWSANWLTDSSLSSDRIEFLFSDDLPLKWFNCVNGSISYDSRIPTNENTRRARDWKIAWCLEKSMGRKVEKALDGREEKKITKTRFDRSMAFSTAFIINDFSCLNVSYAIWHNNGQQLREVCVWSLFLVFDFEAR